jgi:hypothetical protein
MHTDIHHSVVRYNIPESDKTFFFKNTRVVVPCKPTVLYKLCNSEKLTPYNFLCKIHHSLTPDQVNILSTSQYHINVNTGDVSGYTSLHQKVRQNRNGAK